jgi:hypothetical protein
LTSSGMLASRKDRSSWSLVIFKADLLLMEMEHGSSYVGRNTWRGKKWASIFRLYIPFSPSARPAGGLSSDTAPRRYYLGVSIRFMQMPAPVGPSCPASYEPCTGVHPDIYPIDPIQCAYLLPHCRRCA